MFLKEPRLVRKKAEKGCGSDDYTGADGGAIYRKYQEYHYQIGLDIEEMKKMCGGVRYGACCHV